MRRALLGISAILLLLSAGVLWFTLPDANESIVFASCWRMSAMLGAAWLAYEDVQRLPTWLLATTPILLILLVRWPRQFLLLVPFIIAAAFFYSRFVRPR
jgi:hypothetical protein